MASSPVPAVPWTRSVELPLTAAAGRSSRLLVGQWWQSGKRGPELRAEADRLDGTFESRPKPVAVAGQVGEATRELRSDAGGGRADELVVALIGDLRPAECSDCRE